MNLELVTTEELWDEIAKRHSGAVLITITDISATQEGHQVWYRGGRLQAIGMLEQAKGDLCELKTRRVGEL